MFSNDCNKCRQEVKQWIKAVACQKCDDWYLLKCVGLQSVSYKVLKCRNLLFPCDECVTRVEEGDWEALTVRSEVEGSDMEEPEEGKEEVTTGNVAGSVSSTREEGQSSGDGEPGPCRKAGGPLDSLKGQQDHTYSEKAGRKEQERVREDNPDREDRSVRPKQQQNRVEREPEKGHDSKVRKERTRREQEDYNRKEQENSGPRERRDHGRERPGTWMGVG